MPSRPRKQIIDDESIGYYHCISRCVRRAFLCGTDSYSGRNFDHRRDWLEKRIEFLAGLMSIDVIACSFMDNHYHLVLRNRPDIAGDFSKEDVVRRWQAICPGNQSQKNDSTRSQSASDQAVHPIDAARVAKLRARLSSISWFLRFVNEYIARKANREDDPSTPLGKFWNGRFRSIKILDTIALIACVAYVDLNPIKAKIVRSPSQAKWTSAYYRILDRKSRTSSPRTDTSPPVKRSSWLAPLEREAEPVDGHLAAMGRRASDDGFIDMTFDEYLALLNQADSHRSAQEKRVACSKISSSVGRRRASRSNADLLAGAGTLLDKRDFAGSRTALRFQAEKLGKRWLWGVRSSY